MNYRHAYHAGNFADVFKHAALTLLVTHLGQKEKPFVVIDTHAGIGRYDLEGVEARKTGEAREGILGLLRAGPQDPALSAYLDAVAAINEGRPDVRFYPGSPLIARRLLRSCDRLVAVELHPEDGRTLEREFRADSRVSVRIGDGYATLKSLLPPRERRGLVLIDPPFEVEDEFRKAACALKDGIGRWATGIFALWYPVKAAKPVERFLAEAALLGRPAFSAEFLLRPPDDSGRLNGAGLLVVNPSWKADAGLGEILAVLGRRLGARGPSGVRWIRTE